MKNEEDGAVPAGTGGEQQIDKESLDYQLFVALRTKAHSAVIEKSVVVFTRMGNWGLFWLGFALLLWLLGLDLGRGMFIFLIPVVYLTLLANNIVKYYLKRERPMLDDPALKPLVHVPASTSFPSSHAAMSFAAAVAMTFYYAPFWAIFFGLAFMMSWSRVYVGVHFPSDVMAGTFVGLIMGTVCVFGVIFI